MSNDIKFDIAATPSIPLVVKKALDKIELNTTKEIWEKVDKGSLLLELLSSVAVVSSDSLYRMAVRMGYEGTEEDFVEFLMTESKDGIFNIDNKYPLESGYYTLQTAIAAVIADTTLSVEQKNGMIFTFFDGTQFRVFQFNKKYTGSESAADFANPANWDDVKTPRADGSTFGKVKLTDEIDGDEPSDVSGGAAVTPKAVVDFVTSNPGGLIRVNSYENLPAVGSTKVIYYTESSGIYWIFTANGYKKMTPEWNNIKVIRGNTSIAITESEIVTM